MAEMDAARRNDRARSQAGNLQRREWRPAAGAHEPARRPRPLYLSGRRGHALPRARLAGMELDRQIGFVWLRPADEPGHHRPLRPRAQQDADPGHVRRADGLRGYRVKQLAPSPPTICENLTLGTGVEIPVFDPLRKFVRAWSNS